ncbi:MAG: undecaprenyl-diphosphate phosphatase [Cytophagaceae bacterium]|nr:undecaprenyl-diphosphate phosphatase [Cytophagaceae bacterium]
MNLIEAIILAIVEGLTEFLPVSSTGHMILVAGLMSIQKDSFVKSFEIVVQFAAILSVLVVYYKRFLVSLEIYFKLFVAFLPFGTIAFFTKDYIKEFLFNPAFVSFALIAGGVVLILLDKWSEKKETQYEKVEDISYKKSFLIGLTQCFALFPGVSRAAATIFGGLFAGFNRKQAAEYSFLLAVPTMFAATGAELLESGSSFTKDEYIIMGVGGLVAFIFALLAIKTFISFVTRFGFVLFGYYRIVAGVIFLLVAWYTGMELSAH